MRKERLVTRTVDTSTLELMVVDTETAEVSNITVSIPHCPADGPAALAAAKAVAEHGNTVVVQIVHRWTEKCRYSMSEAAFIKAADKEATKPETETAAE